MNDVLAALYLLKSKQLKLIMKNKKKTFQFYVLEPYEYIRTSYFSCNGNFQQKYDNCFGSMISIMRLISYLSIH